VAEAWLPSDVADALTMSMKNPAAMSCSDREARVDARPLRHACRVEPHEESNTFLEVAALSRGQRAGDPPGCCARTRFLGVETATGKEYRVHGLAFAEPVAAACALPDQRRVDDGAIVPPPRTVFP